jgi:adenylate cyclase
VAAPLPRVRCVPRGDVLRPAADETLLAAALRSGVPLASSCGGRAVCGDCVVRVTAGVEHVLPPDDDERAWRARKRYEGPLRLACCVRVTGDCAVATTYW